MMNDELSNIDLNDCSSLYEAYKRNVLLFVVSA